MCRHFYVYLYVQIIISKDMYTCICAIILHIDMYTCICIVIIDIDTYACICLVIIGEICIPVSVW